MSFSKISSQLKSIYLVILVFYLPFLVFKLKNEIVEINNILNWKVILVSLFFVLLSKISSYLLTSTFINIKYPKKNLTELFLFASKNQLLKYIPGGIWHYLDKFIFFTADEQIKEKSKLQILKNISFEILIFSIIGSVIILFLNIVFDHINIFNLPSIFLMAGIISLLIINFYLLKYFFGQVGLIRFSIFFLLSFLTLFFISYSIFILFNSIFSHLLFSDFFLINTIATILSFYVFFAPGGLGVKEYLIVFLLNYLGLFSTFLLLLAILHRLIVIVGELVIYIITALLIKRL